MPCDKRHSCLAALHPGDTEEQEARLRSAQCVGKTAFPLYHVEESKSLQQQEPSLQHQICGIFSAKSTASSSCVILSTAVESLLQHHQAVESCIQHDRPSLLLQQSVL
jgi:hypothetical protein